NDDHHLGSRAYVAAMDEQAKRDLVAMINVDMVGRGPSLVVGRLRETVPETHTRLVSIARRLGVPVREVAMGDVSDHGTFIKAGMSAGWLWSGEDPVVHSPGDTFDRVQPASVERAGRVALEAARSYT
ncbi:MAG TPA: M28 family peptidase, partial [Actinomycetota bacterium]|nr:M28 family peptidase [Actinomycetota bacterium]